MNKHTFLVYKGDSSDKCLKKVFSTIGSDHSSNTGQNKVVFCHPVGIEHYKSKFNLSAISDFELTTYFDWVHSVNNNRDKIVNITETTWVAKNMGAAFGYGTVRSLSLLHGVENNDFTDAFNERVETAGFKTIAETEKRLVKRLNPSNYRDREICVIDADYLNESSLNLLKLYCETNKISLIMHFNKQRLKMLGKEELIKSFLKGTRAKSNEYKFSNSNSKVKKVKKGLVLNEALKIASTKYKVNMLVDDIHLRIASEMMMAFSDRRYKSLDGSIVETSKGIKAYFTYLKFLMSGGVGLLEEFSRIIGIDYQKMFKKAKEQNNSVKFEEFRKITSYCFFSELSNDAEILNNLLEASGKSITQITETFMEIITPKLNEVESLELDYCIQLVSNMDREERINIFDKMYIYQIEPNAKYKICSLEYGLKNLGKLSDSSCLLMDSDASGSVENHIHELSTHLDEFMVIRETADINSGIAA